MPNTVIIAFKEPDQQALLQLLDQQEIQYSWDNNSRQLSLDEINWVNAYQYIDQNLVATISVVSESSTENVVAVNESNEGPI